MTTNKEEKNGLPWGQWVSIMLTLASIIVGGLFYLTNMEKRLSIVENQQVTFGIEQASQREVLNLGMGKRLELQRDMENFKELYRQLRDENYRDHQEIKSILNKLLEEKRLAALKQSKDITQ